MQKLFNILALVSFVSSGVLLGGAIYAYRKLPEIKQNAAERVKEIVDELVSEAVEDVVPGHVREFMPKLPTNTGPAIPLK